MNDLSDDIREVARAVNNLIYAVREIYAYENTVAESVMNHTPHADNANIRHYRKCAYNAVEKLRLIGRLEDR